MALTKNTAGQKIACFAVDTTTDLPKTGLANNDITVKWSKDGTSQGNLTDQVNSEDGNLNGIYYFDLTQAETNGDLLVFSFTSATANVLISPLIVYTAEVPADVNVVEWGGVAVGSMPSHQPNWRSH